MALHGLGVKASLSILNKLTLQRENKDHLGMTKPWKVCLEW